MSEDSSAEAREDRRWPQAEPQGRGPKKGTQLLLSSRKVPCSPPAAAAPGQRGQQSLHPAGTVFLLMCHLDTHRTWRSTPAWTLPGGSELRPSKKAALPTPLPRGELGATEGCGVAILPASVAQQTLCAQMATPKVLSPYLTPLPWEHRQVISLDRMQPRTHTPLQEVCSDTNTSCHL